MSFSQRFPQLPVQDRKRKHSEISSLNNDSPSKRMCCVPEEAQHIPEETNMWTTVKGYLQDPAGRPVPLVECPICMYPIAIRGVPNHEPDPWKLADGSQKVGAVLPCAHIICQGCFNRHRAAQNRRDPDGKKTCPSCRASLLFTGCEHPIPPQRLPVASSEDFSSVALTMPELRPDEHLFPEDCWECTTHGCEAYIDLSMRFISGALYGVEYQVGEGPGKWQDLVERHQVMMWNYLDTLRAKPNWRNGSVPAGLGVMFAGDGGVPVHLLDGFLGFDVDAIVHAPTGEALWGLAFDAAGPRVQDLTFVIQILHMQ